MATQLPPVKGETIVERGAAAVEVDVRGSEELVVVGVTEANVGVVIVVDTSVAVRQ